MPALAADPAGDLAPTAVPSGAPARIGATIGAFERLLIVTFVLVNAVAAVGFVIAAKTLARFKQLDDRGFAEYYLLGTLASTSVAIGSALIAQAALRRSRRPDPSRGRRPGARALARRPGGPSRQIVQVRVHVARTARIRPVLLTDRHLERLLSTPRGRARVL